MDKTFRSIFVMCLYVTLIRVEIQVDGNNRCSRKKVIIKLRRMSIVYAVLKTLDTMVIVVKIISTYAYKNKTVTIWTELVVEIAREGIMEKKHACHAKLCVFRCLISRPKNLNLRSWNQSRGKLILSRKLRHFMQRELFLNMFYTINLFPLLVIKKGFTLIFILSNYQ